MSELSNIRLMARYNQWMNETLFDVCESLPQEVLDQDQGAYFHSISGTLNHLLAGDKIWLKRFSQHPAQFQALQPLASVAAPQSLNEIAFSDLESLRIERELIDSLILEWCEELTEADLDVPLHYANMKGVESVKRFGMLLQHFFNHQTHHRGQVTTLLSQQQIDVGITDLLMLIPDIQDM
ncbi:DinB family protein [Marinobacterium jannaschii]|uniref:DinB family protein n=1 Tax=Marinobacterium jannaschii TaxID=64970 RepID=UPI0004843A72|nr:DinB family protein [Marinobacterium jannaschii]